MDALFVCFLTAPSRVFHTFFFISFASSLTKHLPVDRQSATPSSKPPLVLTILDRRLPHKWQQQKPQGSLGTSFWLAGFFSAAYLRDDRSFTFTPATKISPHGISSRTYPFPPRFVPHPIWICVRFFLESSATTLGVFPRQSSHST